MKKTIFPIVLSIALTSVQSLADSPSGKKSAAEYDARLTGYDYPHPVKTFPVNVQGQSLEMNYMDVHPEHPNGQTVLLLHGKNFSGAYWERTMNMLVEKGYRVVAPDQIGFGKSSKPTDIQYSFHALATYTKRLLDHLGVNEANVVGHSMGGMLASRFTLMFPETTRKLVLVNPIGLEDWKRKVPYRTICERYQSELDKTPKAVKSYMKSSYFDGTWKEAYDPLLAIQAGWIRGPDHRRIAKVSALAYDMIFTQPVVHEFPDITVPTLLIIGQRDRTALGKGSVPEEVAKTLGNYPELGQRTAEAIPNSQLAELDDVGHVPHFEAWDQFRNYLLQFLSEQGEGEKQIIN